jgi:hypothetical protein
MGRCKDGFADTFLFAIIAPAVCIGCRRALLKESGRRQTVEDKQLAIPGLPVPEPKPKLIPEQAQLALRLNDLESRVLKLELELSLLKILMEKGENK